MTDVLLILKFLRPPAAIELDLPISLTIIWVIATSGLSIFNPLLPSSLFRYLPSGDYWCCPLVKAVVFIMVYVWLAAPLKSVCVWNLLTFLFLPPRLLWTEMTAPLRLFLLAWGGRASSSGGVIKLRSSLVKVLKVRFSRVPLKLNLFIDRLLTSVPGSYCSW